jgi:CheY-like chemotaxis protein
MTVLQDLRVLVVENDEMSAALLQMQLVHAGATVVGLAASVAEALRAAGRLGPDVALLDYRLARNETSEPVAAALSARGVPFVLATGMLAEQLPEPMLAGLLLVKPYLSADLSGAGRLSAGSRCGGLRFQRNGGEERASFAPASSYT